ncbi:cell wall-active antibiotics response protein LiaF [Sporolactobacillus kofuensis]|uniref:Cell wall-active antibiotics response protein LiaF n=1 Tax=Sporolactobacillus kofuensis TaxID=269672 RepID=A0ABW1WAH9_9BACL|nr:cell wall-active antibiotics response protein LiaF [Sporolactobacillus kofuensis]MCO7175865.1 cell wall-active antibiotics response protein LiaF [Sporolactobacillus kofuensis]
MMRLGKIFVALAIVILGVYWLLDSLNLISQGIMSIFSGYLSFFVLLFGFLLIIAPLIDRKKPHFFWGLFFLIYGGLLLAGQASIIDFGWPDFWKLWPYLIIYFGFGMLFGNHSYVSVTSDIGSRMQRSHERHRKHRKARVDFVWNDQEGNEQDHEKNESYSFVSDSTYKHENWMVKPLNERVRIGDYTFDFTKAFIPEETIPITLSGWVGNIKITMPEDLAYRVSVRAKVGDVKIRQNNQNGLLKHVDYQTSNYDEATRRIDFDFDFQVIDLRIVQV